jgi:ABC-type nickel/cobalt efflux system permease component RcnA
LPFDNGSFDCAVAAWMLYHAADLNQALLLGVARTEVVERRALILAVVLVLLALRWR